MKHITGIMIGNDKKEAKAEMLRSLLTFYHSVEIVYFRKIPYKDLFDYCCKIELK
jgi:hypothetical protein